MHGTDIGLSAHPFSLFHDPLQQSTPPIRRIPSSTNLTTISNRLCSRHTHSCAAACSLTACNRTNRPFVQRLGEQWPTTLLFRESEQKPLFTRIVHATTHRVSNGWDWTPCLRQPPGRGRNADQFTRIPNRLGWSMCMRSDHPWPLQMIMDIFIIRFAWSVNGFYSFFWLVATNTQGTHIGQRDRHLINVP